MKALDHTGKVIELAKDCACVTHDGPHWLHANDAWHAANRKLLDDGNGNGFVAEEAARLEEKIAMMKHHGLHSIIREGSE